MPIKQVIRSAAKPICHCCADQGTILYSQIQDTLFGAEGLWNIKRCNNPHCRLMWLDPSPLPEDIHFAYERYYTHTLIENNKKSLMSKISLGYQAEKYGYLFNQTNAWYRWLGRGLSELNFFKEHMDYPFIFFKQIVQGRLLELGVGSGATFKAFLDWGWQADGIDFDAVAVKACVQKGLNVREGDLFSQNFESSTYDAIFSAHFLEHVPSPIEIMIESVRILKTDGVFVAITPNGASALHHLFKKNWRGLEPPRHLHIFTELALRLAALKAGFSRVEVVTSNFSAAGVFNTSFSIAAGCKNSFVLRLTASFIRLLLTFYRRLKPMSGEELILIAYK